MLFELFVATDACEVRLEIETAAGFALVWPDCRVLHVGMLACAWCSPSVHVEPFPARQPMLSDFFWSTWDESEAFALAFQASIFQLVFE